jgi:hypothetical protein
MAACVSEPNVECSLVASQAPYFRLTRQRLVRAQYRPPIKELRANYSLGKALPDHVDRLMAVSAPDAVCAEVRFIKSKDLASLQGFGGRDHRGVR